MPRLRSPPFEVDYYEILGVTSKATQHEIRRSFKRLVLEAHPDKNPHRVEWSERRIRELIQAFEVIGNADARSEFDRRRRPVKSSARKKERPFFFYRSDPMARARLILYLLLNGRPRRAAQLLMEMEKRLGGGFLLEHLERADYLDCLFLLAEHYSGERQYVLAAERLNAFYADDSKSRYPRHYLAEVVRRLKDLYLRKLPRSAGAQDAIEGLESARRLGLTKAEELLRLRKLIEIQTRAGRLGDARESLLRARKLDPKGRGLAKAEAAISLAARKAE